MGGKLYGELWLPLARETQVVSELELPGTRGPVRTTHRLVPRRRWTVYCMIAADTLVRHEDPEFADHADLLHIADQPPAEGVSFALDADGLLQHVITSPMLLAGSGFNWIGVRNAANPLARMTSRDGSEVIAVALALAGTPADLGLAAGRNEMTRRVEQWIEGGGAQLADEKNAVALVIGSDPAGTLTERVADWNSRYAYPRLVTDRPEELLAGVRARATVIEAGRGPVESDRWKPAVRDAASRADKVFEPLTRKLSSSAVGLAALAGQFAFRVPGTLVVNPTPFAMSGLATMPDGTERLVTDVPAWGYVCLPGYVPWGGSEARTIGRPEESGSWIPVPGSDNDLTLDNRHFQVRIEVESGAIRSLITRAGGREWARREGGLNAAPGSRLGTIQKIRNAGVATRMVVGRRTEAGTLTSTITVYDDLPCVDITNQAGGETEPVTYEFNTAMDRPDVSWEVPAGFDQHPAPIERLVHLRWIRLMSGSDAVYFRGLDAPVARVSDDGRITSVAPRTVRYRLGFASGFSAPEDPWRFGWGTEKLLAVPVPGTGRATLPSFGSLFVVDQAGACIIDLRRDSGGDGVIVYVQELIGVARDITVGPGVLTFRAARRVDFTGRDLEKLQVLTRGGVAAPVRPFGITALHLTGVELATG